MAFLVCEWNSTRYCLHFLHENTLYSDNSVCVCGWGGGGGLQFYRELKLSYRLQTFPSLWHQLLGKLIFSEFLLISVYLTYLDLIFIIKRSLSV
jgi:hypothetical protein